MTTTEDREGTSQVYEVGYLILPSIPEDKLPDTVSNIQEIIKKHGGKEVDGEMPFKQQLAYSMSKTIGASNYVVSDAYMGWTKFDLPTSDAAAGQHPVEKIKADLDTVNEILRFLVIKAPLETGFSYAKAREKEQDELRAVEELVEEDAVETTVDNLENVVE